MGSTTLGWTRTARAGSSTPVVQHRLSYQSPTQLAARSRSAATGPGLPSSLHLPGATPRGGRRAASVTAESLHPVYVAAAR